MTTEERTGGRGATVLGLGALVWSVGLTAYFVIAYLRTREVRFDRPATVAAAVHLVGTWRDLRPAWAVGVLLALGLAVVVVRRSRGGRRALLGGLGLLALAAVGVSLWITPARFVSPEQFSMLNAMSSRGYAPAALLCGLAAVLQAVLVVRTRTRSAA
ncbi:MAG: hypothetical protein ACXVXC_15040 [Nocardioidaceae bacterium]